MGHGEGVARCGHEMAEMVQELIFGYAEFGCTT